MSKSAHSLEIGGRRVDRLENFGVIAQHVTARTHRLKIESADAAVGNMLKQHVGIGMQPALARETTRELGARIRDEELNHAGRNGCRLDAGNYLIGDARRFAVKSDD